MSLSRLVYEPFYTLSDFDRLFEDAFNARSDTARAVCPPAPRTTESVATTRAMRPRMDIHEDPKENKVTAMFELPGLKKEDVNIDIQNDLLTVSGESKQEAERSEEGYAVRERRYGRFQRSIPLPAGIKPDDIKASMDNGILTVTFPKTSPEQGVKKITIQ